MVQVDCDFPGGNIIVEEIEGNTIRVRQDLRDTEGHWFYWYFRVRGAARRHLRIDFTDGPVIGARGPAVSLNGGNNWSWLGTECASGTSFTCQCPPDVEEVRFAMAIPYVQQNLDSFLSRYADDPALQRKVLCASIKGRDVEWLQVGQTEKAAPYRMLITARHHCCEMMANYVIEGVIKSALSPDDLGSWFRDNVSLDIIPFMDKDGVEQGDQGKNRKPRDHGRDYQDDSIYPETAEVRRRWLDDPNGQPHMILDLHCPHLCGEYNEYIYFPGNSKNWQQIQQFSTILEANCKGPLRHFTKNNLPFGQAWNVAANYQDGRSLASAAQDFPGIRFAASLEIPYSNVGGATVTPEACRAFGHDLCASIRDYLEIEEVREVYEAHPAPLHRSDRA